MRAVYAALLAAVLLPVAAHAVDETVLHSFTGFSLGSRPTAGLVPGTGGNLYGGTQNTFYRIAPDGSWTNLHTFSLAQGFDVANLLRGSDGNFYGTTSQSGGGNGTVFRITPAGAVTTLAVFPTTRSVAPSTGLARAADGTLYGTLSSTGPLDHGAVYRVGTDGSVTILHDFANTDGSWPLNLLLGSNGKLYGSTYLGGSKNAGVIYRIDPATGVFTVLYEFQDGADGGRQVRSLPMTGDGSLYGTTVFGAHRAGTIFRLSSAGVLTTLHDFTGSGGHTPSSLVRASDGTFYGTTTFGGVNGNGTVFRLATDGTFTTLHNFGEPGDGTNPVGLVPTGNGTLVGVTNYGGGHDVPYGSVFRLNAAATPSSPPVKLELDPPAASLIMGEEHCIDALVTDAAAAPVNDAAVALARTGTVAVTDRIATNRDGAARNCFTSFVRGTDTVAGSAGSATATATVGWT